MKFKLATLFLTVLVLALSGCKSRKVYTIIDEPNAPLGRFGAVSVGKFNTKEFLASIESDERRDKYAPVTQEMNDAVMAALRGELAAWEGTKGGPPLVVSAVLDDYATGSGALRGMSRFGMFGNSGGHSPALQLGQGVIDYTVTLMSGSTTVATYRVAVRITGASAGAYKVTGRNIAKFLFDEM